MNKRTSSFTIRSLAIVGASLFAGSVLAEGELNIYNWGNYTLSLIHI